MTSRFTDQFDAAIQTVTQERENNYGHPAETFRRMQAMVAVVRECPDPEVREALEGVVRKVCRLIETPAHLDSWIDIAGYARTGVMVLDYRNEKEEEEQSVEGP